MELTDLNYKEIINTNSDKIVMIDFWAPWCGPCKSIASTIDELEKEFEKDIIVAKYNIDKESELVAAYGIRNVPTFIFIKNNEVVDKISGTILKNTFIEKIKSLI